MGMDNQLRCTIFKSDGKFGVRVGRRVIIPANYDHISIVTELRKDIEFGNMPYFERWSNDNQEDYLIIAWTNPKYGPLYSRTGESPLYGWTKLFDLDGKEVHLSRNGRVEWFSAHDSIHRITQFDKNLFRAETMDKNGKRLFCLFNSQLEVVLPFKYEYIRPFDCDANYKIQQRLIIVGQNIKYGVDEDDRIIVTQGDYGVVDPNGNCIVPLQFDKIESLGRQFVMQPFVLYGDYIKATRSNKCGLFLSNGELLFPLIYTDIKVQYGRYIKLYYGGQHIRNVHHGYGKEYVTGGQWSVFSIEKQKLSIEKYDAVMPAGREYLAQVVFKGEAGFLDYDLGFHPCPELSVSSILSSNTYYDERPSIEDYGYSQSDYEDMYKAAYEGDSSAIWNTD